MVGLHLIVDECFTMLGRRDAYIKRHAMASGDKSMLSEARPSDVIKHCDWSKFQLWGDATSML
jgi:hypothetical protein